MGDSPRSKGITAGCAGARVLLPTDGVGGGVRRSRRNSISSSVGGGGGGGGGAGVTKNNKSSNASKSSGSSFDRVCRGMGVGVLRAWADLLLFLKLEYFLLSHFKPQILILSCQRGASHPNTLFEDAFFIHTHPSFYLRISRLPSRIY